MAPPRYDKFQIDAMDDLVAALRRGENALLVSPTGSGKTGMLLTSAVEFLISCNARPSQDDPDGMPRALFLTHRRNLLDQLVKASNLRPGDVDLWTGIAPGRITADEGVDQEPWIVAGMVQTVANAIDREKNRKPGHIKKPGEFDLRKYRLIVIDEAHHAVEATTSGIDDPKRAAAASNRLIYKKIMDWATLNKTLILGGTATAFRTRDEETLDARFEQAHRHVVTYQQAIDAGRIVPPKTELSRMDLGDRRTTEHIYSALVEQHGPELAVAGVSAAIDAAKRKDLDSYLNTAIDQWIVAGKGGKTLWFCDSVPEARRVAELINERMAEDKPFAAAVYAEAKYSGNAKAMSDYEAGRISVLVSCRLIGEGYDVPDTDRVVVGCKEPPCGWLMQMAGRAMRAAPGKKFADVLDLGAASLRYGKLEERIAGQALAASMAQLGSRAEKDIARDINLLFGATQPVVLERDQDSLVMRAAAGDRYDVIRVYQDGRLGLRAGRERSPIHQTKYWSSLELCMMLEKQSVLEPARVARAFAEDESLSTVRQSLREKMRAKAGEVMEDLDRIPVSTSTRPGDLAITQSVRLAPTVPWSDPAAVPLRDLLRDCPGERAEETLTRSAKALLGLSLAAQGRVQVPEAMLDVFKKAVEKKRVLDVPGMAKAQLAAVGILAGDRRAAPSGSAAAKALRVIKTYAERALPAEVEMRVSGKGPQRKAGKRLGLSR